MRPRKLLRRLVGGSYANVSFRDLQRLIESCGFELERIAGSHHIYGHPDIPLKVNIQDVAGAAKPYQVRQFHQLLERYDLIPEDLA